MVSVRSGDTALAGPADDVIQSGVDVAPLHTMQSAPPDSVFVMHSIRKRSSFETGAGAC
jgi:hypothetical protein